MLARPIRVVEIGAWRIRIVSASCPCRAHEPPSVEMTLDTASADDEKPQQDAEGYAKKALLKAAMRLLSALGREGATSRAICAEVGVGAPTMYHYYGDLAGLHRAAIDETYLKVAEAYQRGAKEKGPQQGLRNGWGAFNHFAHEEPRMCRIVIQQIMAGQPPALVGSTLRLVENDLAQLYDKGLLNYSPHEAVQLLWMGTLGTACFTATEQQEDGEFYPRLQQSMIDIVLDGLFKKPLGKL